jgi:5-methylcytosine-specific restriction endonuclease McrA
LYAFVLEPWKKPLTPCRMARARLLLKQARAAVFRRFPFTIILRGRTAEGVVPRTHRIKIDPGAKTTGLALVQEATGKVVAAAEITHRGTQIKARLDARRALRRARRQRKTRYRKPRFANRTRPPGWLPPSLESRLANVLTWVERLRRRCPITAISQELVKFDTQALEDPEIHGVEYQQGTLAGYEVREYLLAKWRRTCAYCGKTGVPLQIEHIEPRSRGGTDRVSNLTLACEPCNARKGNLPVEEFLKRKPDVLARMLSQARAPLKDAALVNATRWELFRRLEATGLPVECGSGAQTKFNRATRGLPKAHWVDAVCVGASTPASLSADGVRPLVITACGHGRWNRCWTDRYGFPVRHAPWRKSERGFRTGDIVRADIPGGKHRGTHIGRISIRFRPSFRLGTIDVHPDRLTMIHRGDGYDYSLGETFVLATTGGGDSPAT